MEMNNELERLRKYYENEANLTDSRVFTINPGDETRHTLYGTPKASYAGFTTIEDFDQGIKDIKNEIKDYDTLLFEVQSELKEIVKDLDLYNNHPEIALPGELEQLNNKYTSLLDRKNILLEKKSKEEKNLEKLQEAKKELLKNKRDTYKSELKEKEGFMDEYARAAKEMKDLEAKILVGDANNFEKERYGVLKNEILPELEDKLNHNVEQDLPKKDEQSNDNPEPVSRVKNENPVKMPEKSIKKLQENIDRVQDEINADLKVVKKPLPKNIKQKVNEIKTSKPNLKEKIQTKLATAINAITKIKEKIAEFRENRENQKLSASEEQINQEESKAANSASPASKYIPEEVEQEPITNIDKVNNLEDDINKYSNLSNEEQSQVKISEEVNQQENRELTEEEIYKIAGFNNPKTR